MAYKDTIKRFEVESLEKWKDIIDEVPSLRFKSEWDVKIIPPFSGAVARFFILKDGKQVCSVYLDWHDRLASVGQPYYELYPFEDDAKRYLLNEIDELMSDIDKLFSEA
jgi:hypothetical protein